MAAHISAAVARLGPPTPGQITRLRLIFAGAARHDAPKPVETPARVSA
jgi:hypothetical protein